MRSAHGDRHSVRAAALANQSERQQNGANRKVDTHMKRKWKGLLAVFLAVMLMASCSVAGAVDGEVIGNPDEIEELPLAKTADLRLDEDYRATVTLTMPSYAEPLETDVVFVLDTRLSLLRRAARPSRDCLMICSPTRLPISIRWIPRGIRARLSTSRSL